MPSEKLRRLAELIDGFERDVPLLSSCQRHDRLTAILRLTMRVGEAGDARVEYEIDRLVLRACNAALSSTNSGTIVV